MTTTRFPLWFGIFLLLLSLLGLAPGGASGTSAAQDALPLFAQDGATAAYGEKLSAVQARFRDAEAESTLGSFKRLLIPEESALFFRDDGSFLAFWRTMEPGAGTEKLTVGEPWTAIAKAYPGCELISDYQSGAEGTAENGIYVLDFSTEGEPIALRDYYDELTALVRAEGGAGQLQMRERYPYQLSATVRDGVIEDLTFGDLDALIYYR